MKRIIVLLLALFTLLPFPLTAYAHDVPQKREDCSIEVIVRYDGENVDGGTLTAIKVGYENEENGNYFFSQEYTGIKLEDITSADAPQEQKKFYHENKDQFAFYTQTQSVENGKAVFADLPTGLYLIIQDVAAPGFSELGAFLVSVPYLQNGEYQYHVTTVIKSEMEREPESTESEPTDPSDPWLPQTGQWNWPIPLMAVAGLAFFVVGWALCFGKKERA